MAIKIIPKINGRYQCLTDSFTLDRVSFSIINNLKVGKIFTNYVTKITNVFSKAISNVS